MSNAINNKIEFVFIYYLRVFACLLIVLNHVCGSAVDYYLSSTPCSFGARIFLGTIDNIIWFAVDTFFMITGYIYLSSSKKCTYESILKNTLKTFLYLLVFGVIFTILLEIIGGRRIYSVDDMINILMSQKISIDIVSRSFVQTISNKNQWGHMWFMYEILKVYLVLPIIKAFTDDKENNIYILILITVFFNILLPFINKISHIAIYNFFPVPISITMVILGGIVSRQKITDKKLVTVISVIATIIIILFYVLQSIQNGRTISLGSSDLICIALAILSFGLFVNFREVNKPIRFISNTTLIIYLIHPMFIHILYGVLKFNPLKYNVVLSVTLTTMVIFVISLISGCFINFIVALSVNLINKLKNN